LPDNEDDAVAIDELQDQIAERVNNRVIELFRESDVVNTSNGKLYKDA